MSKSISVEVDSEVFGWLRDSSGWTNQELAKRLDTSEEVIEKIELGEKEPTLRQLRELSTAFRRPIASFLLSEPKKEKPKPKDYRMLPNKVDKFDKKTLLVLRNSRRLQEVVGELSRNIGHETKTKLKKVSISDNPEILAGRYREILKLTPEKQRRFRNAYELFGYLRDSFEDMDIFVFQFSMPIEDARGFVFVDETPYVIVVNTKDSIEARLFSLMHEFGHILLGESAIDFPDPTLSSRNLVESWCNKFSASFLLPKPLAIEAAEGYKNQNIELKRLSNRYKVSKAVLLINMLKMGYLGEKEYERILKSYIPEGEIERESPSEGGIPSDVKRLSEVGNRFVSLVATNYDKNKITYSDALDYLSIKSKRFDKLLSKARK